MRASLPSNLPWIRSVMIVGSDGRIQCSTTNMYVGVDLSDRPYLIKARKPAISFSRISCSPGPPTHRLIMAAYPVSAISSDADLVIFCRHQSRLVVQDHDQSRRTDRRSSVLVDSTRTVLAAPADQADMIGKPLGSVPLLSAIAHRTLVSGTELGSIAFAAADGSKRLVNFAQIPGTQSRLIVSIDEARVTAAINHDIRTAYLQLGFVCLFVLFGALWGAEKLIIRPIEMMTGMAKRFGEGDWSARVASGRLPSEFVPLARAFNAMAAQLSQRERELVATNDRLTVMAWIDMLFRPRRPAAVSRGRLDFEWMKALRYDSELSLLMIDVDHFKLLQRQLRPSRRRRLPEPARRNAGRHRRRHHGLCRPLRRRGVLPAAAGTPTPTTRAGGRRAGARRRTRPSAMPHSDLEPPEPSP